MAARRQGLILLLLLAGCDQTPAQNAAPKPSPKVEAAAPAPTPAPQPMTCAQERGEEAARILANRCRMVSPATRPPCNPQNSCELIEAEIARACADMSDVEECAGPTPATSEGELYKAPITSPDAQ